MALGLNRAKIGRKIALYAVICGLLGVTQFLAPASLTLGMFQSKLATKPVSGDIVVVGIDSDSIRKIGRWPWPRDKQAELLQAIDNANPKSVFVDIGYQGVTDPVADATLRRTLEDMKSPVTIAALATTHDDRKVKTIFSHFKAVGSTKSASVHTPYLFSYVWTLPYVVETSRGPIKSMSAEIADVKDHKSANYRIDISFDPETIMILSAKDVLKGTSVTEKLAGKKVLLGLNDQTQDIHFVPGWGERPGILLHVLGAESLINGAPRTVGFFWFYGPAAMLCLTLLTSIALRYSIWILTVCGSIILAVSTGLTIFNIGNDPLPAIALLICTGVHIQRQKMALARSQRNSETGFSDMTSYFVKEVISNAIFIGASIRIADTRRGLAQNEASPTVMKEVGRRLSAIIDERQITHNLQGQFLWESPAIATAELAAHLEGLKQLFAPSLLIDGRNVDIDIFFGIDRDVNTSIAIRSKRALDASREAMQDQSTFKIATTSSLENQLRSRFREELEEAITNGDITTVFQAQKTLATNSVDSAEVCLRWTHPAHGHIPTTLIVDMASKSGNLELISILLCRNALEYNKKFNEEGLGYRLSAKISTAALQSGNFHDQLSKMTKHGNCNADMITLQIVDPKKAVSDERILAKIKMLKAEGFGIAIGNFGQTNDDLDMILAIKPNEIILARTFSRELLGSTSNSIYVDAALRIARAHNIITTAEDVEDRDILNELRGRGCDKAQGKIIAIPLHYKDFIAAHSPVRRANVG